MAAYPVRRPTEDMALRRIARAERRELALTWEAVREIRHLSYQWLTWPYRRQIQVDRKEG